MWLIIPSETDCWGVLLLFLMTPEDINRGNSGAGEQQVRPSVGTNNQSMLMKLLLQPDNYNRGPTAAYSQLQQALWGGPPALDPLGRCGEVPDLRQQLGPIRTLLETCTPPQRQWCERVTEKEKGGRWKRTECKCRGLWVTFWFWLLWEQKVWSAFTLSQKNPPLLKPHGSNFNSYCCNFL